MTFLYIHGFNSDGDGWKAQALKRQFPIATVLAPDLPADPKAVITLLDPFIEEAHYPLYLIGTSLGGFYAYYLSAKHGLPAWLFNPSLAPYITLQGRGIGRFKTWTKQRDYHFREEYLDALAEMSTQASQQINESLLRFFLAKDDDVLDHSKIPESFQISDIHWYPGAGHGFSKFEKVIKTAKKEGWL